MKLNQDLKIKALQDLTKFQLDLVDTLENTDYEWYYGHTFRNLYIEIKVSKFDSWTDVMTYFYNEGKRAKAREIKNVLGIIDPVI